MFFDIFNAEINKCRQKLDVILVTNFMIFDASVPYQCYRYKKHFANNMVEEIIKCSKIKYQNATPKPLLTHFETLMNTSSNAQIDFQTDYEMYFNSV